MIYAELKPDHASSLRMLAAMGVLSHMRVAWTVRPRAATAQAMAGAIQDHAATGWAQTMQRAASNAGAIPEDMIQTLQDSNAAHLARLRLGQARGSDWYGLMAMVRALIAIEHGADFSVQKRPILRAWDALVQLQDRHFLERARTWVMPLVATEDEIDVLDYAYAAHGAQLDMLLSRGELHRHIKTGLAWSNAHLEAVVNSWREPVKEAA
jgi:hypothetical protein